MIVTDQTAVRLEGALRVVGIDPGLTRMGLGVVEEEAGRLRALACDTIVTSPGDPVAERLAAIYEALTRALTHWRPDAMAVERIFYKLNARTAVPVAQASGVALLAAARFGTPVFEYAPLEVKQAVVGSGSATKEQVRYMVSRILRVPERQMLGANSVSEPGGTGPQMTGADWVSEAPGAAAPGAREIQMNSPDAADALAVTICHLHSRKLRALGGTPR
jgi:crossover junction endodeoxyribonuclease RuvC